MEPGPLCLANCIPVISQLKSVVIFALDHNPRKAWNVQLDFAYTTTVVSQGISILYSLNFESQENIMVQKRYLQYVDEMTDAIWFVGPIKYIYHCFSGDRVRARRALRGSTKTIAFLSAGSYASYQMDFELRSSLLIAVFSGCCADIAFKRDQPEHLEWSSEHPEEPVGTYEGVFNTLADYGQFSGLWACFMFYLAQHYVDYRVSVYALPYPDYYFRNCINKMNNSYKLVDQAYLAANEPVLDQLCMANCIPVISQLKSLSMLLLDLNLRGSLKVQADFINTTTIISQILSLIYLLAFNKDKAVIVQRQYFQYVGVLLDALPFIGHFRATYYMMFGNSKKANEAFFSSTRTFFVLWAGIQLNEHLPKRVLSRTLSALLAGFAVDIVFNRNQQNPDDAEISFEYYFDQIARMISIPGLYPTVLYIYIIFSLGVVRTQF